MSKWGPWRDERGRFARITPGDVADAIREGRRVVFERAANTPRPRKTRDVWHLLVDYGQGWEHETTELSLVEARAQLRCYRDNCPEYPARLKRVRESLV